MVLRSEMARVTGLEPATSGVTGRHSNQLSYTRAFHLLAHQDEKPCSKTAFPKADGGARQAGFAPFIGYFSHNPAIAPPGGHSPPPGPSSNLVRTDPDHCLSGVFATEQA
jgi:hypothetical protein